jgi:hypothetical protein
LRLRFHGKVNETHHEKVEDKFEIVQSVRFYSTILCIRSIIELVEIQHLKM